VTEGRIYGRNPVLELLRAHGRRADEIAVLAGASGPLAEIVALARRAGVKVSYRTREQLTAIAGSDRHQGVVARVASAEYIDLGSLLEIPGPRREAPFFLALDQVQERQHRRSFNLPGVIAQNLIGFPEPPRIHFGDSAAIDRRRTIPVSALHVPDP